MIERRFNKQRELSERVSGREKGRINGKLHSIYFNALVLTRTENKEMFEAVCRV